MPISFRLGLLTFAGLALLALPAAAQSNPPRPPGSVPNRAPAPPPPAVAPGPPPLNMQDAMPPEEMDEDIAPPPVPTRPQTATRGGPPPTQLPGRPGTISGQPLAPPPGTTANAPGTGPSIAPVGEPGAGQMKPPQPASTAPQPGDEVVVEMPAVKIQNPVAVFAGLDKITGRIIAFDVKLNEKVQFGALQVTPRVCFTRPTNEAANTDGFIDVDEVTLQGETKRLFTGWMFAASPGLHAVEHPIYDVWLTGCKGGQTVVADTQPVASGPTQSTPPGGTQRAQQPPAGGGASPPSGTPPKPPAGSAASPPAGTPPKPSAQQRQSAQQPQGQGAPQPVAQAPAARQPPPPPPPAQSPFQFQWPPRQ
jgi:hypothetical protein